MQLVEDKSDTSCRDRFPQSWADAKCVLPLLECDRLVGYDAARDPDCDDDFEGGFNVLRRLVLGSLISCLGIHYTTPVFAEAPDCGNAASNLHLLIVAPDRFHDALTAYLDHKRQQLPTELISLEAVLQESRGQDDPEKLKRRLYTTWKSQSISHVLLVGDADVLPVRYMVLDRVTPAAYDYAFYPSDLYYGDLAKQDGTFEDWNAEREGFHAAYFGEVRGEKNKDDPINFDAVDYLPEVAVGRWPVSTPRKLPRSRRRRWPMNGACCRGQSPTRGVSAWFAWQAGSIVASAWTNGRYIFREAGRVRSVTTAQIQRLATPSCRRLTKSLGCSTTVSASCCTRGMEKATGGWGLSHSTI